jgi:CheY-like chemotaxis protein
MLARVDFALGPWDNADEAMERTPDHQPPPETILFVEDELLIRMDMAEFLRQTGYRVSEAANAAEALDALNSKLAIDVVITDVKMPGKMDGFALAEWIRANRPGVEIILASADESSGQRAMTSPQLGPFLAKPYTGRSLLDLVKETLSKRRRDASGAAGVA